VGSTEEPAPPAEVPPPIDLGTRRAQLERTHRGRFDEFAEAASNLTGKGPSFEVWNLVASTITGVVTFLLVALLQNSQRRAEAAVNEKLNALAAAVADLMRFHSGEDRDLRDNIALLQATVGLEERISATGERLTQPVDPDAHEEAESRERQSRERQSREAQSSELDATGGGGGVEAARVLDTTAARNTPKV
jgi:low affinity Fe/Cu permease